MKTNLAKTLFIFLFTGLNVFGSTSYFDDIDKDNWEVPVLSKSKKIDNIMQKILKECPEFRDIDDAIISKKSFIKKVQEYTKERKKFLREEGITLNKANDSYIEKLDLDNEEKSIFMGDLHGSVHSLIRNLKKLQTEDILDKNHFLEDDYNLVFLGDIADRGDYGVETWHIILSLALRNKDQVKIIRGNHESSLLAEKYGFFEQISNRYPTKDDEITSNLEELFENLPSAIYVGKAGSFIQACHGGIPVTKTGKLNIPKLKSFLKNEDTEALRVSSLAGYNFRWGDIMENPMNYKDKFESKWGKSFTYNAASKIIPSTRTKSQEVYNVNYKHIPELFKGTGVEAVFSGHKHGETPVMVLGQKRANNPFCTPQNVSIKLKGITSCIFTSCPEIKKNANNSFLLEGFGILEVNGKYQNWNLDIFEDYVPTKALKNYIKKIKDNHLPRYKKELSKKLSDKKLNTLKKKLTRIQQAKLPSDKITRKVKKLLEKIEAQQA